MRQKIQAQVLTIYVGEQDHYQGGPLYATIVERLKEAGIAGATVLHGAEGYGAHGHLHTDRILVLFEGLPMVIQAVDIPERINTALALLDEIIGEGLVTVQDVQAIRYNKDPHS
jgi:PII-like signaling protein